MRIKTTDIPQGMKLWVVGLSQYRAYKEGPYRAKEIAPRDMLFHNLCEVREFTIDFDPCVPEDMITETFWYYGDYYWVYLLAENKLDALRLGKTFIRSYIKDWKMHDMIKLEFVRLSNEIDRLKEEIGSNATRS
jgi:hypothetical protein